MPNFCGWRCASRFEATGWSSPIPWSAASCSTPPDASRAWATTVASAGRTRRSRPLRPRANGLAVEACSSRSSRATTRAAPGPAPRRSSTRGSPAWSTANRIPIPSPVEAPDASPTPVSRSSSATISRRSDASIVRSCTAFGPAGRGWWRSGRRPSTARSPAAPETGAGSPADSAVVWSIANAGAATRSSPASAPCLSTIRC